MGGIDIHAPLDKVRRKGETYLRQKHVKRDMQNMLDSLYYMTTRHGDELMQDERSMLMQIAEDHGLRWPEGL